MRISDWSSDVCSSDLKDKQDDVGPEPDQHPGREGLLARLVADDARGENGAEGAAEEGPEEKGGFGRAAHARLGISLVENHLDERSEERRVGKECVRACRHGG